VDIGNAIIDKDKHFLRRIGSHIISFKGCKSIKGGEAS